MSHSCSLAQVLLAGAVLLKVDDTAAGDAAHLHRQAGGHGKETGVGGGVELGLGIHEHVLGYCLPAC